MLTRDRNQFNRFFEKPVTTSGFSHSNTVTRTETKSFKTQAEKP